MVEVFPFRAFHFDSRKVGDLSAVVTQPYDKIDASLQETYYQRHDRNIVRVIRRRPADEADPYAAAAEEFRRWIADGSIARDLKPAIYVYHQIFTHGGERRVRKGFTALLKLEEFGKSNGVLPHEETHSGPKADRFRLLSATHTHFGQIFLLFSDTAHRLAALLDSLCEGPPVLEAKDDFGETHKVWQVTDPAVIRSVQREMKAREVIIADGHHRYETALNFKGAMVKAGAKPSG